MPSMKKFTEFSLSMQLLNDFTEAAGPTRINKTTPEIRHALMQLAAQTACQVSLILDGKVPSIRILPHRQGDDEEDILP